MFSAAFDTDSLSVIGLVARVLLLVFDSSTIGLLGLFAPLLHHLSGGLSLSHESSGLVFAACKELIGLLLKFFNHGLEIIGALEIQALDRGLDVLLLDASLVIEVVVSLQLLNLNHSVDHLGGHALRADEFVHLLLGLKLGQFEATHGIDSLFTCQFLGGTKTEAVAESLELLLVDRALGGLHEVDLSGLLEDLLRHLKGLVEIGLDKSLRKLLPVRSAKDKLLE